jgi:UDP-galactopyranose mutase
MPKYDYLIVGCGLFGAVFAQRQIEQGKRILIIEKRKHIGGNCYTESKKGIYVHTYGPHIFHTDNVEVWEYVNRFASFNAFVNRPKVFYKGRLYSFPINLMTLYQLWGVVTPQQAEEKLKMEKIPCQNPANLEQWILSQVGSEIYEIFIRGYTTKQWGRTPDQLPAQIIQRLPVRLTFDDNYYNDPYQGVPMGGYTAMFETMLRGIEVQLKTDYLSDRQYWNKQARTVVYTGMLDEYFEYSLGRLEYRHLRFEEKSCRGDFQGNAVINYTEQEIPYTRSIEHKHFEYGLQPDTIVTYEYPSEATQDSVAAYPVNTPANNSLYQRYKAMADQTPNLLLGGRLAAYRYMDMDDTIFSAMKLMDLTKQD